MARPGEIGNQQEPLQNPSDLVVPEISDEHRDWRGCLAQEPLFL
jgi:hypothetical protein